MAGLFAAILLHRSGWEVDVFERSAIELSGRGAGIVTHPELIEILELGGADTSDLGVSVRERIAVDRDGHVLARHELPQVVTSWDRLHQLLRPLIPPGHHHLGHGLVGIDQDAERVTAHFANGRSVSGELLIGADGFRSTVRAAFAPDLQPAYAGYVVWRGLAEERDLPAATHAAIFERFSFFLLSPGNEVLGYPIAGPDNDLRRQHRRFNWVWYRWAAPDRLKEMLTDAAGVHHEVSIAPPLIRDEIIQEMRTSAAEFIARPFLEILDRIARPFFTPVYELASSRMVFGRVALIGDAAHLARPHVGMGVTKAAADARALADCLAGPRADLSADLARFAAERGPIGRRVVERGRELGTFMYAVPPQTKAEQIAWQELHSGQGMMRHTGTPDFLTT